jgi:hypothetical protein
LDRAARKIFENGYFIWIVPDYVDRPPQISYILQSENISHLNNIVTIEKNNIIMEENIGIKNTTLLTIILWRLYLNAFLIKLCVYGRYFSIFLKNQFPRTIFRNKRIFTITVKEFINYEVSDLINNRKFLFSDAINWSL